MASVLRFSDNEFSERRGSARVIDAVALDVRLYGQSASEHDVPAAGAPARFAGFEALKASNPEAVKYILSLESQLGLLQRNSDGVPHCEFPTHKVSLSSSGIAFAHDKLLQPGDRIVIDLVLFPAQKSLSIEATVVSVGGSVEAGKGMRGGKYAARAIFNSLGDDDRVTLDQHIQSILRQL